MKTKSPYFLFIFLFILLSNQISSQVKVAYSGTIFVDGNIITSSDSSAFKSITATGRGIRTVYDRRTSSWNSINAILFKIVWNDGITSEAQVNPEFGDSAAQIEAKKYGIIIGRIPTCLRKDVKSIWIHKGKYAFGGGNNSILIHTEQSVVYEKTGILEETLVHEATHTSLDKPFSANSDWLKAQSADINFISTYAKENPTREDVAESFLMWIACRQNPVRISQKNYDLIKSFIPNRLDFFDKQNLNLFPLNMKTTNLQIPDKSNIEIFPNPFSDVISINSFSEQCTNSLEIFTLAGNLVLKRDIDNPIFQINTKEFVSGFYLARIFDKKGIIHSQMLIKI